MTDEMALSLTDLRFAWPGSTGFGLEVSAFSLTNTRRGFERV